MKEEVCYRAAIYCTAGYTWRVGPAVEPGQVKVYRKPNSGLEPEVLVYTYWIGKYDPNFHYYINFLGDIARRPLTDEEKEVKRPALKIIGRS